MVEDEEVEEEEEDMEVPRYLTMLKQSITKL